MQMVALAIGTLKFHRFLVFWIFFWHVLTFGLRMAWLRNKTTYFCWATAIAWPKAVAEGISLLSPWTMESAGTKTLCQKAVFQQSNAYPMVQLLWNQVWKWLQKSVQDFSASKQNLSSRPRIFVIPCAVLDSAKLVAEGIRQVCHKKRANEGCNGILKCAFHGHHFALRHKLRMLCIIV